MTPEQKADKFLGWLAEMTDYGDWHENVQREVRAKLMELLRNPNEIKNDSRTT